MIISIAMEKKAWPKELSQPVQLLLAGDSSIFVFDMGKKILPINRFTGEIKESLPFKAFVAHHNIVLNDNHLYFSNLINPLAAISQYNLDNNKEEPDMGVESQSVSMGRHIVTDGALLYSINGENKAEVSSFNLRGDLIQTQDLSNLAFFREPTANKAKGGLKVSRGGNVKAISSGRIVIQDAQLFDGKLYLLSPQKSKSNERKTFYNTILILEKTGSKWKPTKQIKLSETGTYMTFRIYDEGKKLVTFETVNGNIEIFSISKQ